MPSQENKDVLVAVMDVFVKEPLVDWRNESLKRRAALGAKGRKGAVAALRDGDEDEQMELLEQVGLSRLVAFPFPSIGILVVRNSRLRGKLLSTIRK